MAVNYLSAKALYFEISTPWKSLHVTEGNFLCAKFRAPLPYGQQTIVSYVAQPIFLCVFDLWRVTVPVFSRWYTSLHREFYLLCSYVFIPTVVMLYFPWCLQNYAEGASFVLVLILVVRNCAPAECQNNCSFNNVLKRAFSP